MRAFQKSIRFLSRSYSCSGEMMQSRRFRFFEILRISSSLRRIRARSLQAMDFSEMGTSRNATRTCPSMALRQSTGRGRDYELLYTRARARQNCLKASLDFTRCLANSSRQAKNELTQRKQKSRSRERKSTMMRSIIIMCSDDMPRFHIVAIQLNAPRVRQHCPCGSEY